jgi:hypothetical protein
MLLAQSLSQPTIGITDHFKKWTIELTFQDQNKIDFELEDHRQLSIGMRICAG